MELHSNVCVWGAGNHCRQTAYEIESPVQEWFTYFAVVSQWCSIDSQTLQMITLDFDYSLDLDKILLLRSPCTSFIKHGEIKLVLTGKLHSSWLRCYAYYWKRNAIISSYITVNSVNYNNNLPGKKCFTGEKWLQCNGGSHSLSNCVEVHLHKAEPMFITIISAMNLWWDRL